MKMLIVNQPTNNRGDESAHRALVRTLAKQYPDATIRIVFMGVAPSGFEGLQVQASNVIYENIPIRGIQRLARWSFIFRFRWLLTHVRSGYRLLRKRIRDADWVISAPSGICLGPFRSWYMLLVDWMVQQEKKPFAYYSPSFGPKPEGKKGDALFWQECINTLKQFDFLSIRDAKTMTFADGLGLNYEPSIDTAFLDAPAVDIPTDLQEKLGDGYVVFVPNSLTWHVAYRNVPQENIDKFYYRILKLLERRFPDSRIALLPQLYGLVGRGDYTYFLHLREGYSHPGRLEVLPETCNSDLQQAIIARSRFVVGARYHSVVFAINNAVPFVSLTYEHKMSGLLHLVGLEENSVDIQNIGKTGWREDDVLAATDRILKSLPAIHPAKLRAREVAWRCFAAFADNMKGQRVSGATDGILS